MTEIETYLQCPQRWFQSRVVRPGELDREFGAREKGSFAHDLLARFYGRFLELGHERVSSDALKDALALFDEEAARMVTARSGRLSGLREEAHMRATVHWARSAVEMDASILEGWRPVEFEWTFGIDEGRPFELTGVRLKGTVDRIDIGPRGVVVTDYKSGQVWGVDRLEEKGLLQAIVYALAAAEHVGQDEREVRGAMYRSLSQGVLRGFWRGNGNAHAWLHEDDVVSAEGFQELVSYAERAVASATEGMSQGIVEARPLSPDSCRHCPAVSYCPGVEQ